MKTKTSLLIAAIAACSPYDTEDVVGFRSTRVVSVEAGTDVLAAPGESLILYHETDRDDPAWDCDGEVCTMDYLVVEDEDVELAGGGIIRIRTKCSAATIACS